MYLSKNQKLLIFFLINEPIAVGEKLTGQLQIPENMLKRSQHTKLKKKIWP